MVTHFHQPAIPARLHQRGPHQAILLHGELELKLSGNHMPLHKQVYHLLLGWDF